MKNIFPILAFIVLFQPAWPFVEYFLFKNHIVSELCINKDNPESECDGSCFFHDQLALHSDQDHKNGKKHHQTEVFLILFFEKPSSFNLKNLVLNDHRNLLYAEELYTQNIVFEIFQPPRILA